jgi:hypothetical protein
MSLDLALHVTFGMSPPSGPRETESSTSLVCSSGTILITCVEELPADRPRSYRHASLYFVGYEAAG